MSEKQQQPFRPNYEKYALLIIDETERSLDDLSSNSGFCVLLGLKMELLDAVSILEKGFLIYMIHVYKLLHTHSISIKYTTS